MSIVYLTTPITEEQARSLKLGDIVYISGTVFTARDMAHLRIKKLLEDGGKLPCEFSGAAIFHAGPVAVRLPDGGWKLNLIGPTTSIRMEPYADMIGRLGVHVLIGKGGMGEDTLRACEHYGYVFLQASPGCAAQLAQGIEKINSVTWLELGMPEAVWELKAANFGPFIVGMDAKGGSVYKTIAENAFKRLDELYPVGR